MEWLFSRKKKIIPTQLSEIVRVEKPKVIIPDTQEIFGFNYEKSHFKRIKKCLLKIDELFAGKFPGYRACNTEYHNFEHTAEVFQAAIRLLDGYNLRNPKMSEELAIIMLMAILLHDTGYIQEEWDTEGTGARYTESHVERSVDFLHKNRSFFGIDSDEIELITKLIKCTGLGSDFHSMSFKNQEEKIAGSFMISADLLGQMSNRAYLEKLLFLYREFKEAKIVGFDSEFDLLRKTVDFYEIIKKEMEENYFSVHLYARDHFKERFNIDRNLYTEAIERQMSYLHAIIEDDSTNFRNKLKRSEKFQLIKNEAKIHV